MTTEQGRKCCNYCFDCHDEKMDLPYCRNPQCPHCHTKPSWEERFDIIFGKNLLISEALKSFLRTEITRANNELAEKIAGEMEFVGDEQPAKLLKERIRSFIRNEEEI